MLQEGGPTTRDKLRQCTFSIALGGGDEATLRRGTGPWWPTRLLDHLMNYIFCLVSLLGAFLLFQVQPDLEKILKPQLMYFCQDLPFDVIFHNINPRKNELIYEDRSIQVFTIPLKHRVPCCGFLFEEKPRDRHIIREMIDFYHIPTWRIPKIKQGEDFITETGEVITNNLLTVAPEAPKRFAYCSDTAFSEKIIPMIEGVDCLYHEATFMEDETIRSNQTEHSTARQAGEIARRANVKKLIIGHLNS